MCHLWVYINWFVVLKKVNILKIKVFYKEDKQNQSLVGFGIDSPINLIQYPR